MTPQVANLINGAGAIAEMCSIMFKAQRTVGFSKTQATILTSVYLVYLLVESNNNSNVQPQTPQPPAQEGGKDGKGNPKV